MNVFLAGIHGVGKTYLASQMPDSFDWLHVSASQLIKDERSAASWQLDKRVTDAVANQVALAKAVRRYNEAKQNLLLDGHFVLLSENSEFLRLGWEVFESLRLQAVLLIEAAPEVVAERINQRDGRWVELEFLNSFLAAERAHAQLICGKLNLPLHVLTSPSKEEFVAAICSAAG